MDATRPTTDGMRFLMLHFEGQRVEGFLCHVYRKLGSQALQPPGRSRVLGPCYIHPAFFMLKPKASFIDNETSFLNVLIPIWRGLNFEAEARD